MNSRLVLLGFLALLAVDALAPPRVQPSAWVLRGAIRIYQLTLSPVIGGLHLASCRFQPTCSEYGRLSIAKYGTWVGGARAVWRVLRCNPFGGSGQDLP